MTSVDLPQSYCRAALARRDITPPVGIYHRMWGAATHDRSTGIHRPLTATALALGADEAAAMEIAPRVIIGIDHCLLWTEQMDQLRAAICQAVGLHPDQLLVSFSHTHAAGLMDPTRESLPGGELIGPYLTYLSDRMADATAEALGKLQPARIVYGASRCQLAAHRDYWDTDRRQFVCGFNPKGEADDTLLVARVETPEGETLGIVVNYACHPTTLAWDNTLISPDYVGAMRELVEGAVEAPCLFLQGASGDLGPREGFVGEAAIADRNGRQLGYAVLSALEALPAAGVRYEYAGPVVSGATIGTWRYVPLTEEQARAKARLRVEQFDVGLPYREGLPDRAQTETELAHWQSEEQCAHAASDESHARHCRAQAERMTRQLARIRSLPAGDHVPVRVTLLGLGDAIWVMLEGEHYQYLQQALRDRFPQRPLIVATVTGGWRPGYVPTQATYGRGIYQESIAVVAPGALEHLVDVLGARLESWA